MGLLHSSLYPFIVRGCTRAIWYIGKNSERERMIRTCGHSAKSFLFRIEAKEFFFFLYDNEIEWTTGASSGLSYFDQIVLRRGKKTATPLRPCAVYIRDAQHSSLLMSDVTTRIYHGLCFFTGPKKTTPTKRDLHKQKNRNKQEWEREKKRTTKKTERYRPKPAQSRDRLDPQWAAAIHLDSISIN